jgi:uncharacterized protein (DUF1697 family)
MPEHKYLALLRGINVGGKNKVEMKELRAVFEGAGFSNVSTFINSGNVIFEAEGQAQDGLPAVIETALSKHFGFQVPVLIREAKVIRHLAAAIPEAWQNDDEQKTDILFLQPEFDGKKSIKLIDPVKDIDNVIYVQGAIAWNIRRADYAQSRMNKFMRTELYKNMTARNVNTVRKLAQLMS